ncbi:carbon-nitrogen hydrolase family protein [Solitalea longa]|uniref:Carbon-nitrogen hydrolase family protein n=1 Tax=Solitalea longa TaxID=2079460 RepID=A0A2S5A447_9SPHI|nr:carbon-nitrogen hydrolase family protein [Solitalea longa]POY37361.1 carbon-nitrogen hydrolase family protein [Solitalea longa]
MRISIVQTKPLKGTIDQNLRSHVKFIEAAVNKNVDLIVFPELSLTGYEPELAQELATTASDSRLDVLQQLSDKHSISIWVGLPTRNNNQLFISMIIIQPNQNKITYSKQYLFPPEREIFTSGNNPLVFHFDNEHIVAPAICFELSNPEHHEYAAEQKATIYIASVLNSVTGVDADIEKLSAIAKKYKMTVFMANYVGQSGGYECAGRSSVWDQQGQLIAQLDGVTEGQLIYDTKTTNILSDPLFD